MNVFVSEGEMKPHYFEQTETDEDDIHLKMAKQQGYVPQQCLLGGIIVMEEIRAGLNPCRGCYGPREKCGGSPISENLRSKCE